MKSKFIHFLIRISLFSLVLSLAAVALWLLLPAGTLPAALPWLFVLFFGMTIAVHYLLLRFSAMKPARFVNYFMITTFFKLILYSAAVLVYVFTVKTGVLPFILAFFLLYIFYTVFEVVMILAQTGNKT